MPPDVSEKKLGLKVISLFAGAGGLEIAVCSTGQVAKLVSSDAHPVFLETTRLNLSKHFPEVDHDCFVADARQLDGKDLISKLGGRPDLLMGGPPCDDFTSFGLKRGLEGGKGSLIYEFARLVGETHPRAFLFENVPNLVGGFKAAFEALLGYLAEHGYSLTWGVLKACDFGAPTLRQRVFVVGWDSSIPGPEFQLPQPTHGPDEEQGLFRKVTLRRFTNVSDVLDNLSDVILSGHPDYPNHTGRTHRPETIEHMKTVPPGVAISKSYRYRAPWDGLCRSLTAGMDNSTKSYIHPIHHREMSVREYARIHGFPDSWCFCGTHHNGIKQVANAVPVLLGKAVLHAIVDRFTKLST